MQEVLKYIETNRDRFIEEMKELLRIPSISNNDESKPDMIKCAEWLREHYKSIGLENIQIFETPGHPVVYGDWLHAGKDKPTILIYGHYDVQPVDPVELWTRPPFEPEIVNNVIYARGTTDDKGQLLIHLKSIEAYLKTQKTLPVNIKVILEGEEEIGSPNIGGFLNAQKDLLKCDYVIISDTSMFEKGLPSICYALRGLVYMEVEVVGPNRDLHSGSFGGGVDNPVNALAHIISKLKDDNGKILIDGFYDDVLPLSAKERAELAKLPFKEDNFKKDLNIDEIFGEEGYTTTERLSARPTLDVNGIWGGYQGKGAKTVLPSKAGAKISMRIVPNQKTDKIEKLFIDFVNKIAPKSVKVNVTALHSGKAAMTPIDSPAIKAAIAALKLGFGKEPVFMREGGSIPIVTTFEEILGAKTVLLGFGLPDENAHSPDEHFDLDNFYDGVKSIAYYYNELSKIKI